MFLASVASTSRALGVDVFNFISFNKQGIGVDVVIISSFNKQGIGIDVLDSIALTNRHCGRCF